MHSPARASQPSPSRFWSQQGRRGPSSPSSSPCRAGGPCSAPMGAGGLGRDVPGAGHQGSSSDAGAAAAAGGDVIGGELGLLGPELIRFLLGINRVSWGRARNWLLQCRAGGRAVFPQIPAEKPRSSSTRLDGACPVPTACPWGTLPSWCPTGTCSPPREHCSEPWVAPAPCSQLPWPWALAKASPETCFWLVLGCPVLAE